ncbi:MAG: hypothetical protein IT210_04230 [Armatimonadetes bacterium]|nr:hypothetical protein [Armatimonadota bacterium]
MKPAFKPYSKWPGQQAVWSFDFQAGRLSIGVESQRILEFFNNQLLENNKQHIVNGDAVEVKTFSEAIILARDYAQRLGLPLDETNIEQPSIATLDNTGRSTLKVDEPSRMSHMGYWRVLFRRFHKGYPMPDYFVLGIDPYESRVAEFRYQWGTPTCETAVYLSAERACQLALEGLEARGIRAVAERQIRNTTFPLLRIIRPNYIWTAFSVQQDLVPFTRLAWVIPVVEPIADSKDSQRLGTVWMDAATGEWLGGSPVRTSSIQTAKALPLTSETNIKAFLVSKLIRSVKAILHLPSDKGGVSIQHTDKTRWSSLCKLLSQMKPLKQAPTGGVIFLTLSLKEESDQLKLLKNENVVRLDGTKVPGGGLGFAIDKGFQEKLVMLAAPLRRTNTTQPSGK